MKRLFRYFLSVLMIVSLSSFTTGADEFLEASYSFTRSGAEQPLIQIEFEKDNTFQLIDRSNPNKSIKAIGKYLRKGDKIKLYDVESNHAISKTWKLDDEGKCIKTRRGLKFTRICDC